MKKFTVPFEIQGTVTIEAVDLKDAQQKAKDLCNDADVDSLFAQMNVDDVLCFPKKAKEDK